MNKTIFPIMLVGAALVLLGCSPKQEQPASNGAGTVQPAAPEPAAEAADAVTTASIVNTPEAFRQASGPDGTWIIAILGDMSLDEPVVLEGQFEHRGEPARKLALYAQDADRTITARYTLEAPRLIVRSENARIQGGTFVGDVLVEADGFLVTDATVQGDVVFADEQYRSTFRTENGGKVTGEIRVQ